MGRKIISVFMAAILLVTAAGCGGPADNAASGGSGASRLISGYTMSVNGSDGKMSITRAPDKSSSMGEKGTWTVFLYLCGTDLESEGNGFATLDLIQILEAQASDKVRFVVQTGGTGDWSNDVVDAGKLQRYVIQDGDMQLEDEAPLASMGDSRTLSDFLNWGVDKYPADKMGVILWDHGSGSINGVCFDEVYGSDSLSLPDLNEAFSVVYGNMSDKFEFIGFDACLMGTVETANVLATYARYMYGSQETEPGTGWDYATFGTFLAENPEADGAQLGQVIADSFYDECVQAEQESGCTLTVVDLEKLDGLIIAFNSFAEQLYGSSADENNLSGIVRGIMSADNFGGNNRSEGYTNMVDIGGIANACSGYADGSEVLSKLAECIVYNKNGSDHSGASGLSVYYPLEVQGSSELQMFSDVCVSPYYLSIVDMIAKGYSADGYSNAGLFEPDGGWSSDVSLDGGYFEYADEESSGESSLITFAVEPNIDENGSYNFMLDENGLEYAAEVSAYVAMDLDENTMINLGYTYDIAADWRNGGFRDNFDGMWLSLADGQILPTYVVGIADEYFIYTVPVYLNGNRTNLRIRQYFDYSVEIEGAWDGIGADGIAARGITRLNAGDSIVPVYETIVLEGEDGEYTGSEYAYTGSGDITYTYLPAADYYYGFSIDDVYGDYYLTDVVVFSIDENGDITFTAL